MFNRNASCDCLFRAAAALGGARWGAQPSVGSSSGYGPSGAHLIALSRHSDEVLGTFLVMAGREDLMVAIKLAAAEDAISELLEAVRQLGRGNPSDPIK